MYIPATHRSKSVAFNDPAVGQRCVEGCGFLVLESQGGGGAMCCEFFVLIVLRRGAVRCGFVIGKNKRDGAGRVGNSAPNRTATYRNETTP